MGEEEAKTCIVSSTRDVISAVTPQRNSTGKIASDHSRSSLESEGKIASRYLRGSTGSCHDICKYGTTHTFDDKEKHHISPKLLSNKVRTGNEEKQTRSKKKSAIKRRSVSSMELKTSDVIEIFAPGIPPITTYMANGTKRLDSVEKNGASLDKAIDPIVEIPATRQVSTWVERIDVVMEVPVIDQARSNVEDGDSDVSVADQLSLRVEAINVADEVHNDDSVKVIDTIVEIQESDKVSPCGIDLVSLDVEKIVHAVVPEIVKQEGKISSLKTVKLGIPEKVDSAKQLRAIKQNSLPVKKATSCDKTQVKQKSPALMKLTSGAKNSVVTVSRPTKNRISASSNCQTTMKDTTRKLKLVVTKPFSPKKTVNIPVVKLYNGSEATKVVISPKLEEKKMPLSCKPPINSKPPTKKTTITNVKPPMKRFTVSRDTKPIASKVNQKSFKKSEPRDNKTKEKILHVVGDKEESVNSNSAQLRNRSCRLSSSSTCGYERKFSDNSGTSDTHVSRKVSDSESKSSQPRHQKNESKKMVRRGVIPRPQAKDPGPNKLKFRRPEAVNLPTEDKAPRKLRFRQTKVVGESKKTTEVKKKSNWQKPNEIAIKVSSKLKPPTVKLRHQDVQQKKNAQGLFNDVIEVTASKLVEARKSKVKALVGAFETVISLQETKITPVSVV